jgi:hypothetical protein
MIRTYAQLPALGAGIILILAAAGTGYCAEAPETGAFPISPALAALAARPSHPASPLNPQRLMRFMPDYGTVEPGTDQGRPLTPKQKWQLALKSTCDPFNIVSAFMTAGFSQDGNQTPSYGEGGLAYSQRVAAALADTASQNLFSAGVLANLVHQDPRYFRMGPQKGVLRRTLYSLSRVVVARSDSGKATFNTAGVGGMVLGIGASNLYYPHASMRGDVMAERLDTCFSSAAVGNLMSEFVPDIQKKLSHNRLLHKFLGN